MSISPVPGYEQQLINTCDIYNEVESLGSANQVIKTKVPIQLGVKCRLVDDDIRSSFSDESQSNRRDNVSKILFGNNVTILDTYLFENFTGTGVRFSGKYLIDNDKGVGEKVDHLGQLMGVIVFVERLEA